jgi:branched-chain amino acid transport system substrate-binding protein
MLLGGSNTGVSIAMAKVAAAKKVPFFAIGAGGASLTGADCTPYTVHYAYDTTALGNGTASAIVKQGGKSWFFVTADYAFGTQLQEAASRVVLANGGKVLGAVRAPLGTTDFTNSLKAANEFGITKTMKPAALLAFISDIHSLGLQTAQGLYLTTSWYWDLNEDTRAFAKRYFAKMQKEPTMHQAAYYSATMQYLKAVKAVGSTNPDSVMAELKKAKINDMFTKDGYVRSDGLMVHTMYVMQVKTPAESKYPWDYYKVIKVMSGEEADGSQPDPTCSLAKK